MANQYVGPLPSPGFARKIAASAEPSLEFQRSGQLTAHYNFVLGAPRKGGRIVDAYISIGNAGKDDTNTLGVELDVKLSGTSIFTTKPKILHVSGEAAATGKTTVETGDAGVTVAVLDQSKCSYGAGDVFMGKLTVTRTASPTVEMQDVAVAVILSPG